MNRWTIDQQRKYRAQIKELGLDDDTRRLLLKRITGKTSTSEIGFDEMSRVITEQEKMLGRSGGRPRTTQDDYIYNLADKLGWHKGTGRLQGFLKRQTGKATLRGLSSKQKSAIIEALKDMKDGRRGERKQSPDGIRRIDDPTGLPEGDRDKVKAFWQRREEVAAEERA